MKRSSLAKACYLLLLACFPAGMLLVVWLSPGAHDWMTDRLPGLHRWLFRHVYAFLPSWLQYFALQTLSAAIAACGTAYVVSRRGWPAGMRVDRRWVFPALVGGYAAWAGLSYFWSDWPYGTRAYFIREAPFYFLCVAAYVLCGRPRRWTTVAKVFAVSASVQALLQALILLCMASAHDSSFAKAFLEYAVFYSNRNFACALVLTAALITIALLAGRLLPAARAQAEGRPSGRELALRLAGSAAALVVLTFVFLSARSLAGYVAAAVAGAAYLVCVLPIRRRLLLVGTVAGVAVVGMVAVLASDRLWTSTMRALLSPHRTTHLRVVDWLTAKELFVRKPVQGWGMGTFPATHGRFYPPLARKLPFLHEKRTTHPHNELARIAAEQGFVGLALYLGVLAYAFGVSYRALRGAPLRTRLVGYALWAGTLTFVVQAAFGKALMNWCFSANFWLLLGVLASARLWAGQPPPPEQEDDRLRLAAHSWVALAVVAAAVGWFWWEWALGGYASMVSFNHAYVAQMHLHDQEHRDRHFRDFQTGLEESRPRFLWPDEALHTDYVAGWYLTRRGQWAPAAQHLERVQRTAPEFQKTRLFLAQCYLNMGRPQRARDQLREYMARDPYDLDAYDLLTRMEPEEAVRALEGHVLSRLSREDGWIVEDYPTAGEVRKLLDLYVRTDRPQAARELVERVRRFFATERVSLRVDAYREVRALEQGHREAGRDALAQKVREMLPEAWAGT